MLFCLSGLVVLILKLHQPQQGPKCMVRYFWVHFKCWGFLKPSFHAFHGAWRFQRHGSDYGANSGLPKTLGKIPASALQGHNQVWSGEELAPRTAPNTRYGWDYISFCLVPPVLLQKGQTPPKCPHATCYAWQHVLAGSCYEDNTPVSSESALTTLQTSQNVNT